jgi:hypothetical protein
MNLLIVALEHPTPIDITAGEVLVVAPALNSRLRHWLSDDDAALAHADQRATAWVDQLSRGGVLAHGHVGDADPLQAIADVLALFPADEILVVAGSTHANHLADELVRRAGNRFGMPIGHARVALADAA